MHPNTSSLKSGKKERSDTSSIEPTSSKRACNSITRNSKNWSRNFRFKLQEESRALSQLALYPNLAAVTLDDTRNLRQSDSSACILSIPVQPLEGAEYLVGVFHIDADAFVGDAESIFNRTDLNP